MFISASLFLLVQVISLSSSLVWSNRIQGPQITTCFTGKPPSLTQPCLVFEFGFTDFPSIDSLDLVRTELAFDVNGRGRS